MLILDLSGILIANLMQSRKSFSGQQETLSEDLLRHMILNSIRATALKFKDHRPVVIACDSKSWRYKAFPHYKAKRKAGRDASGMDWKAFYEFFDKIINEIHEFFPYIVIREQGAEADDVIAVLTEMNQEPNWMGGVETTTVIVSNDKDMLQLQKHEGVKQYVPRLKKFLESKNPDTDLMLHVLEGDSGDGIPNILSDDDTFVNDAKRQKPLTDKKKQEFILNGIPEMYKANFERNAKLIDFSYIPEEVKEKILDSYNINKTKERKTQADLLKYFMHHRLRHLTDNIGDFLK